jgi:hypothetical protein
MVATPDRVRDKRYGPGDEKVLRRDLAASDRSTLFYPVRSVNELLFVEDANPVARTSAGGFAVSPRALTQLCNALATGLNALVRDVSGADHSPGSSRALYSPLEAKKLYNCVLRRRFAHRLASVNLLRTGQLIRAAVGGAYNRLSHVDFLESVTSLARDRSELDFAGARLTAGLLVVRYYRRNTYLQHGADEFVTGWQFANGETGLAAASVVALLARKHGLNASRWIVPRKAGRGLAHRDAVRHDAADLPAKLSQCFDRADKAMWPADKLRSAVTKAKDKKLGLGQRMRDADEQRRDALAGAILYCSGARALPVAFARAAVDSAVTYGASETPDLSPDCRELSGRSVFDLAMALGREAHSAPPAVADRLETVARYVITGQIQLPPIEAEVKS